MLKMRKNKQASPLQCTSITTEALFVGFFFLCHRIFEDVRFNEDLATWYSNSAIQITPLKQARTFCRLYDYTMHYILWDCAFRVNQG